VSARAGKKEKERERGGPAWGERRWAAGPFGPKGEKGEVFCFFLFLFFFKLLLKPLFFSNSNQNSFKLFLKNL
jgi:hypothetical protein